MDIVIFWAILIAIPAIFMLFAWRFGRKGTSSAIEDGVRGGITGGLAASRDNGSWWSWLTSSDGGDGGDGGGGGD